MNTNPSAIRILCYGDSNVWGRSGASIERYAVNERWPGILQEMLGNGYEIIEEGLRSRTTDLDDDDPQFPGRNGLTYLRPCIESHNPLHLVVLWLGTNDLKSKFNRQPNDAVDGLRRLIDIIQQIAKQPDVAPAKILIVSPPLVVEEALKVGTKFAGAPKKSQQFPALYKVLSEERNCEFIDLSDIKPGKDDGAHLDKTEHPVVAKLLYKKVIETLKQHFIKGGEENANKEKGRIF